MDLNLSLGLDQDLNLGWLGWLGGLAGLAGLSWAGLAGWLAGLAGLADLAGLTAPQISQICETKLKSDTKSAPGPFCLEPPRRACMKDHTDDRIVLVVVFRNVAMVFNRKGMCLHGRL